MKVCAMSRLPKKPEGVDNILIIEDEKPLSNFSKQALEMQGYDVTIYESHDSFEDALANDTATLDDYDLIVSDNTTGGEMNGVAFAQKYGAQKPIILCTAEYSAVEQAKENIKGSIIKPFDLTQLISKVNEVASAIANPKEGREI